MLCFFVNQFFRRAVIFIFTLGFTASAFSSVTMLGSRIIYPGSAKNVDVQLKNNDDFPYVIQAWFDEGDINARPDAASNIPFVIVPPVFRIQPKTGHIIRVVHNDNKNLPQDRESVYWFNVLQIPPANVADGGQQNKMLVTLRTRVKLFYRPSAISTPKNIFKGLTVKPVWNEQKGMGVEVNNSQPWFASLTQINARINGQQHSLEADMVAPFSQQTYWFSDWKTRHRGQGKVSLMLINDQGARISESYDVLFL